MPLLVRTGYRPSAACRDRPQASWSAIEHGRRELPLWPHRARKKGSVGKLKREAEIAASGLTPLNYMLGIVRAETPPGLDASVAMSRETLRFEAAKAAAPYCHPRLQAMTLGGDPENPIKIDSMSELEAVRRLAFLLATADAA